MNEDHVIEISNKKYWLKTSCNGIRTQVIAGKMNMDIDPKVIEIKSKDKDLEQLQFIGNNFYWTSHYLGLRLLKKMLNMQNQGQTLHRWTTIWIIILRCRKYWRLISDNRKHSSNPYHLCISNSVTWMIKIGVWKMKTWTSRKSLLFSWKKTCI